MKVKLAVLLTVILLAFVGLVARLLNISSDNGEEYKRQVLSQQKYDSTTLPYKRGDILDKNGTVLASSEVVYNLVVDAKAILADKKNAMEPTLNALVNSFPDLDQSALRAYLSENENRENPSQYKVFLKQLSYDKMEPFMELKQDPEKGKNIKGVWFEEEYKRYYPAGSLACDVVGFTGTDDVGQFGLEEFYNDTLNGTDGREYGYLNDDENLEHTVIPAVDGNSIVTTIDANIQSICEKYLKEFSDAHMNEAREGLGANNLGCIVMEVNTGNVLAMASYPNFDLNDPKNIDAYFTPEQQKQMENEDTLYSTYNELWRNFCISDTYEPGSTMKPFTVAAALDAGVITGEEVYQCNGFREIGGHKIKCHNTYGDGPISVKEAVEKSCNVGLMYIAEALGTTSFCNYQHNFNFGLKTNIDLSGEARTDSLLYNASTMGSSELATNSFGQSFNVTMIQMITGFCALVNGGNYYEPHMVSKILSSDGSTLTNIEPRILKQVVSPSVSNKIIDYCNGVVTNGTGKTARPAGYAIGGKTGTAETLPRGNHEYVVSFMGYAPAENPEIAVYVVVDRPNVPVQDDAKYATGIVRNILTETLPYLNIFMTEEVSEEERIGLEEMQLSITTSYQNQLAGITEEPEDTEGEEGEEGEEAGKEQVSEGTENAPVEGEASPQADTAEGATTEQPSTEGENPEGEGLETVEEWTPIWTTFEVDPSTGNYIDPNNGHQIDPETGHDLTGGSVLDE